MELVSRVALNKPQEATWSCADSYAYTGQNYARDIYSATSNACQANSSKSKVTINIIGKKANFQYHFHRPLSVPIASNLNNDLVL